MTKLGTNYEVDLQVLKEIGNRCDELSIEFSELANLASRASVELVDGANEWKLASMLERAQQVCEANVSGLGRCRGDMSSRLAAAARIYETTDQGSGQILNAIGTW